MKETSHITISDVAKKAGVSTATVGRVVGRYGMVSDKTKQLVLSAIDDLGYTPNTVAQGLRSKKTKTIAVVVGAISNSFFASMVCAIENEAADYGYNVIICNTNENPETEKKHIRDLRSRMIDGIILSSALTVEAAAQVSNWDLYKNGAPLVLVDRRLDGLNLDVIVSDNFGAGYKTTNYLLALGHKKIGVLGTGEYSTINDRIAGYQKALFDRKIEYQPKRVLAMQRDYNKHVYDERIIDNYLFENRDITALMILNSSLAEAALLRLNENKILDPNELSIICWDDSSMNKLLGLTTVLQFPEEIGREAAKRVISLIEKKPIGNSRTNMIETELIVRSSCRPV